MNRSTCATLVAVAVALTACGGGGGSGSPVNSGGTAAPGSVGSSPGSTEGSTIVYNARAAWTNMLSTSRSWTVSGTGSDGQAYELTLGIAPAGAAVFPVTGAAAAKADLSNLIRRQGAVVQDLLNEQFFDAEYRMLGTRISGDGEASYCSQTSVVAALPFQTAGEGAAGPLYAANTLSDCTGSGSVLGTSYHTWSLVKDAGVAYFCVSSSNKFLGEPTDRFTETCVETDASGTLGSRARIRLVQPDFNIVAKS